MSNHNLYDYALSKKICEDLPKLKAILLKQKTELEPFKHYTDAAKILNEIEESLVFLNIHIEYYTKIRDSKGKIDERERIESDS